MIAVPIVFIIVISMILIGSFGTAFGNVANGGQVIYDEEIMQDYADEQYYAEFGEYDNYENNLLVVFLTNEENDGYYAIAWVGYNLKSNIYNLFGDENTEFGRIVLNTVDYELYKHSLDKNLADVMNKLGDRIASFEYSSPFEEDYPYVNKPTSHLTNKTELQLSESLVNGALEDFTEKTGIPAVIVVDEMEEAIGKSILIQDIILVIILIGLIVFVIVVIVKAIKEKRNADRNGGNGNDGYNNGYNNGYGGNGSQSGGDYSGYRDDGRRW